jgi:hypothetical protein
MAPSGHNSQPWRFRVQDNAALIYADRERALPAVDPQGRELVISCGAALLNLRIAIHHFGFAERVEILPSESDPDFLARVVLAGEGSSGSAEQPLFDAIPERRTNRFPFEDRPVATELTESLRQAAESEGAWLVTLHAEAERQRVADLIAEGDRIQAADPRIRSEMAAWVRANSSGRRDGLRGYSFGHGAVGSLVAPLYIRYGHWGDSQADSDRQLALRGPVLAVLGTAGDGPADWVRAGQALGRVLLQAQSAGVSASFFNQPVEVEALRDRLRSAVGASGHPQLCFRLGYGSPVLPSVRRPLEDVVS